MVKKWEIYEILSAYKNTKENTKNYAMVISNDVVNKVLPVFTIVPATLLEKNEHVYPTEIKVIKEESGLESDLSLSVHQMRTISKLNIKKVGEIKHEKTKIKVNEAIIDYFDL